MQRRRALRHLCDSELKKWRAHQFLRPRRNQKTYVDNVVEETVLRNGSNGGSVVGAAVDGRHSVISRSETVRNIGTENVAIGSVVRTLEERELERAEGLRIREVAHLLNDNAAGSRVSSVFDLMDRGISYWE